MVNKKIAKKKITYLQNTDEKKKLPDLQENFQGLHDDLILQKHTQHQPEEQDTRAWI